MKKEKYDRKDERKNKKRLSRRIEQIMKVKKYENK